MATENAKRKQPDQPAGAESGPERDLLTEFGKRLVKLRESRGWSRSEMARRLDISPQRLANWEGGRHLPPIESLVALRRVFEISLDELITGDKAPGLSRERRHQAWRHAAELVNLLHPAEKAWTPKEKRP